MKNFDSIQLIRPDKRYFRQYKEMMDEWNMEGSRIAPWPLHMKYHTEQFFREMLERMEDVENGINLGNLRRPPHIGYMTRRQMKCWGPLISGIILRKRVRKHGVISDMGYGHPGEIADMQPGC